ERLVNPALTAHQRERRRTILAFGNSFLEHGGASEEEFFHRLVSAVATHFSLRGLIQPLDVADSGDEGLAILLFEKVLERDQKDIERLRPLPFFLEYLRFQRQERLAEIMAAEVLCEMQHRLPHLATMVPFSDRRKEPGSVAIS